MSIACFCLVLWTVIGRPGLRNGGLIDLPLLRSLRRGGLVVKEHFLGEALLDALREDIGSLEAEGAFTRSGLTPRQVHADAESLFGEADRQVCVVTPGLGGNRVCRSKMDILLENLRLQLEEALDRDLILAEQYYSISSQGTRLPVHLDEHHPATKHMPPADESHRRSVAYLLYLSDGASLAGGALRAYHRSNVAGQCCCGAHDGNLQVGWLERRDGASPVFLDGWVPPAWMRSNHSPAEYRRLLEAGGQMDDGSEEERFAEACQPSSLLYIVERQHDIEVRVNLTGAITAEDPEFCGAGLEPDEFIERLRGRLRDEQSREHFSGVGQCHHPRQRAVEVDAVGGTLVLFDAVCVPHEVLPVESGVRMCLGGWFHERAQEYPAWYESAFEN